MSPPEDSPPDDNPYIHGIDASDAVERKLAERSKRPLIDDVRAAILMNRDVTTRWKFDEEHDGWRLLAEGSPDSHRKVRGRKLRAILVPEKWYDDNDGWWICKTAWWVD